jgi:polygalacturonase
MANKTDDNDNKADSVFRGPAYLPLMKGLLVLLILLPFGLIAQVKPGTAIKAADNATHIASIYKGNITVITGSTYAFTVDTPEDKGLTATNTTVADLLRQVNSIDGSIQHYKVTDKNSITKTEGDLLTGDTLVVTAQDGKNLQKYPVIARKMALSGQLRLQHDTITLNSSRDLTIYFTAGQRTPGATVQILIPAGIHVTPDNTTVNIIGRGDVKLKDLATQSIGRTGSKYPYSRVGEVAIKKWAGVFTMLEFTGLDLRPANGADLKIVISGVRFSKTGNYTFKAQYITSKPEKLKSAGSGPEITTLRVVSAISDFQRIPDERLRDDYTTAHFKWSSINNGNIRLQQSLDNGKTWKNTAATIDSKNGTVLVNGLVPDKLYSFRLDNGGKFSNVAHYYSGKMDIKIFGATGQEKQDDTDAINKAIAYLHQIGGGTLLFSPGTYSVRTVHMKSNVWFYIEKGAVVKALKGGDAPETTWFSDKKYRSGLSPTDTGPYADPENYMTKQDVGHHYFRNCMFFGERLDNVKIIGNGRITGDGNLVTGDRVMNNAPDNRSDKMFVFKLCTNIEIGGIYRSEDLWYDSTKDAPYYIGKNGRQIDTDNMLHIDRAGHFVLLATGTDNINVHDTYFAKHSSSNARDIYDFMGCNNVTVTNIYSAVSSDDIVKPGSDCSLGFTRPARNYKVRNIIGDTNCNLFQIGSETADDIMDVHVDNIYVLGANKAGFSISTNDGAHIKDIHLNCGHTGPVHSRSKMYRTFAPFFISISNRGRILGAEAGKYSFTDNGVKHDELLVKNVNIGQVENIILNGIDVSEVYGGSSHNGTRWKPYDGSQRRATSIVAGYSLPNTADVLGGLDFKLPNGKHRGYIKNVVFNDVHILDKGGNPLSDTSATPPELGVGQYNVSNLKTQPSYGLWARHVEGLTIKECSFNYEKRDSRYAVFLDDVNGAGISGSKMVKARDNRVVIGSKNSFGIRIENTTYFDDEWGRLPVVPAANAPKMQQ